MKQGAERCRGAEEEASEQQPAAAPPPSSEKRPRQGKRHQEAPQNDLLGGGDSNALKAHEGPTTSSYALVKSCVVRKILVQKGSLKTGRSVLPSFIARVEEMIAQAVTRAREAGRSSLEPEDFAA